jgi:hypothetical protein
MMHKKFLFMLAAGLLATAIFTFSACDKDDDDSFPAPTVSLSVETFTGKVGESASVVATVTAPGGFKELRVTKYLGTTVDASFGTAGTQTVTTVPFTLNYDLGEEGLTTPVRFNFEAEDDKGKTGDADLIITTEPSVRYLLTSFNWQWKSKMGKCLAADPEEELIEECEKDNVYIFNEDGSMTIDYGALTGSGGGTCDFDGLKPPASWTLSADEGQLTITSVNVFDPNDVQVEVYNITDFSFTSIKSTQTVDLTVFGCVIWDWKFEWTAKPR